MQKPILYVAFATALNGDAAKGLTDTKKAYDLDPNNVANYYNMAWYISYKDS